MQKSSFNAGVLYMFFAYFLWGIFPLYWKLLSDVDPMHILVFRIILSLVLVGSILLILKNYNWLKFFKDRRECLLIILASLTISSNWGLYIWSVNSGYTIEAALGYYINPLISVVFGLLFYKEKINFLQTIAFFLAIAGVLVLTILSGSLPWISLCLSLSFGIYGLIKKTIKLSALESLGSETLIALPFSLILLTFFTGELSYLKALPLPTLIIFLFCGAVTTLPLYLFAKGVKLLPLSTVGFMQFLSPTLTFLTGIFIFKESFSAHNLIVFIIIWTAVVVYIISLRRLPGNFRTDGSRQSGSLEVPQKKD